GIILYASGGVLFESGTSAIEGGFRPFLFRMADLLKRVPYKVLVEGHTDDVPINTPQYPSNWELSSGRASSVVRFFIEETGLPPQRFSAVGYASYKPRFELTPENRARNRRVEMIILKE
ncbi:MAG: OmpA family protein, partial [Candidatus Tectomicrobia bacterium]|nr:OmpA family protein [Candidatus Tectomicrobia bacterium]